MNILHSLILLITAILVALWTYTSVTKLIDLPRFRRGLKSQVFPKWVGEILFWTLPVIELCLIPLLVLPDTRLLGMYISAVLMFAFSIYIGGAVYQFYERYPCPCGGIFRGMGWNKHFKINILLTAIAVLGVLLMELNKVN